jgi:RNA polymerase sigma-70 factor, ECF subfamily
MTTADIWARFSAPLRRFIGKRVADEQAADDILQDVFVKIHSRIDTLQDEQKLEGWVYQIARNAVIDYYRRPSPALALADTALAADEPEIEDAEQELAPGLTAMVYELPVEYREAILLTEYQGLSQKEMAERLGLSFSGAKSRVQRARAQLKAMLLDCCHFEFDRRGKVIDYYPRPDCCNTCACERA